MRILYIFDFRKPPEIPPTSSVRASHCKGHEWMSEWTLSTVQAGRLTEVPDAELVNPPKRRRLDAEARLPKRGQIRAIKNSKEYKKITHTLFRSCFRPILQILLCILCQWSLQCDFKALACVRYTGIPDKTSSIFGYKHMQAQCTSQQLCAFADKGRDIYDVFLVSPIQHRFCHLELPKVFKLGTYVCFGCKRRNLSSPLATNPNRTFSIVPTTHPDSRWHMQQ